MDMRHQILYAAHHYGYDAEEDLLEQSRYLVHGMPNTQTPNFRDTIYEANRLLSWQRMRTRGTGKVSGHHVTATLLFLKVPIPERAPPGS